MTLFRLPHRMLAGLLTVVVVLVLPASCGQTEELVTAPEADAAVEPTMTPAVIAPPDSDPGPDPQLAAAEAPSTAAADPSPQPTPAVIALDGTFAELPDAPIGFPEPEIRAEPVSLSIPALGIGASISATGVDGNGDFDVPGASEVGWYEFGPAGGEPGSTVLAAHIAFDGVDGVFRNLDQLIVGSLIEVTKDDGTVLTYRTTTLDTWAKEELPADLFGRAGDEQLVLITCGGSFNPTLASYDDNVVAIAVPV